MDCYRVICSIDVPVCQSSRRDVQQNLKVYANVTCSECVHLNLMSHVHVHVLRVAKPLYYYALSLTLEVHTRVPKFLITGIQGFKGFIDRW